MSHSAMNPDFSALLRTPLTERLGCRFPVIQTAMGWVADANLVIATTKAGGFGFLAGATIDADKIEGEIQKVIAATGGSNFGLNFHMFQENAAQCVDLAIQYKLRAVSYGRGPDKKTIARFKEAGVLCIPTVGALKHAVKAVELGADMITIQGGEGGGHTGGVPTTILLPQVLAAVKVPVIAAGGYPTGRGLAAALAAGAAGIAMPSLHMAPIDMPVSFRNRSALSPARGRASSLPRPDSSSSTSSVRSTRCGTPSTWVDTTVSVTERAR